MASYGKSVTNVLMAAVVLGVTACKFRPSFLGGAKAPGRAVEFHSPGNLDGVDDPELVGRAITAVIEKGGLPPEIPTPTPTPDPGRPMDLRLESLDGLFPFETGIAVAQVGESFFLRVLHRGHDKPSGTKEEIGLYQLPIDETEANAILAMADVLPRVQGAPIPHGITATLSRQGIVLSRWDGEDTGGWPGGTKLLDWFKANFRRVHGAPGAKVTTLRLKINQLVITGREVAAHCELVNEGRSPLQALNPAQPDGNGTAVFLMNNLQAATAQASAGVTTKVVTVAPGGKFPFDVLGTLQDDPVDGTVGILYTTGAVKDAGNAFLGYLLCLPPVAATPSCL